MDEKTAQERRGDGFFVASVLQKVQGIRELDVDPPKLLKKYVYNLPWFVDDVLKGATKRGDEKMMFVYMSEWEIIKMLVKGFFFAK